MFKRRTKGEAFFDIFNNFGMLIVCFLTIYPIWYVLVNAFNDGQDAMRGGIYWWPRMFSLENFSAVFQSSGIMTAMGITVAKTVIGVFIHVLFTAMVAYAFSRKGLIGGKFYILLGTVTMFFTGGLIPTYLLIKDLNMLDSFLVYIIPFMFSFFDLIIFMTFFREIPDGLEEAAKIDGANDWSIFLRVVCRYPCRLSRRLPCFMGCSSGMTISPASFISTIRICSRSRRICIKSSHNPAQSDDGTGSGRRVQDGHFPIDQNGDHGRDDSADRIRLSVPAAIFRQRDDDRLH